MIKNENIRNKEHAICKENDTLLKIVSVDQEKECEDHKKKKGTGADGRICKGEGRKTYTKRKECKNREEASKQRKEQE